ncbi:hypothetical protein [Nitratireductor sp. XY-223]|uniref:hypothetical protein n=1 Tax=Nitratireductor sp. XY-223 TaxID=2561926 RepID=UPI0010AAC19F|nr:hypothetical protein [Nitratireductor sp. XY-223]
MRGIKRSLVRKSAAPAKPDVTEVDDRQEATPPEFRRATAGAGSAWKAGAVAQAQAGLDEARQQLAYDILAGYHVLEIDPAVVTDKIGSDRRSDWMEQREFLEFIDSIRDDGQEMPVLVWPEDPDWQPDPIDPLNLERIQFLLLAGRRRTEAARRLGRPVRAVLASQKRRTGTDDTFEMLVFRFRENDEREDLSAFERLLSIGEMYEELSHASPEKVKAVDFAKRVGVHESIVSRARAVHASKHQILNAFKNAYELSFGELQKALAELSTQSGAERKSAKPKPKKLKVIRKVGSRNLAVETGGGKLSIKTTGVKLGQSELESLGDLLAEFLEKHRSKDEAER